MVATCPNCQSRFRIADEKVTDRGVRVRCSRCKNVFLVQRSTKLAEPLGPAPLSSRESDAAPTVPLGRMAAAPASRTPDLFGSLDLTNESAPGQSPAPLRKPALAADPFADLDLGDGALAAARTPAARPAPVVDLFGPPGSDDDAASAPGSSPAVRSEVNAPDPRPSVDGPGAGGLPPGPRPSLPPPARRRRAAREGAIGLRNVAWSTLLGGMLALACLLAYAQVRDWRRFGFSRRKPQVAAALGDLIAGDVRSGLYETASGKRVFFVRGRVYNRGASESGPLRVAAELRDADGAALARAVALVGSEPSPEQVFVAGGTHEAEELVRSLASADAPRRVRAGESLPFFALIADPPADVGAQSLQLSLERATAAPAPPRAR